MELDSERAQAVFEALNGPFPGDGIVVAVAAVGSGSSGPSFAFTEGLPEDARFEIGSITKTMTAALLASLVGDGVLALEDEIGRWLEAGPNGNITLEHLATHTSGLPRLAPNQPTGEANPYRDFTAGRAEEGLRTVTRTPDAGFLYSNFGYQLLGLVLERASGQRYQDLLAERLLGPLGMTRSGVGGAGGGTRLTGHAGGKPAGHWDFALPGPGAVEATIGDLARYLAACLAPPERPARDRDQAVPAAARARRRPAGARARLDHHRRAALPQRRNRRVLGVHDDRPGRRARHGRAGEHACQLGPAARRCRHGGRQGQRPAPGPATGHRGDSGAGVGRAGQGAGACTARRRLRQRPPDAAFRRASRS